MRVRYKVLALLSGLCALSAAQLSAQTFFGEDLDGSRTTRSAFTNALNAEALFLANLTGVGTETFDSGFTLGSVAPLGLDFGTAGTATLNGGGCVSNWTWSACSNRVTSSSASATGTNGYGRYSVDNSLSGGKYWEADAADFSVSFSNPVAAFGFFGIDIGDFGGSLSLAFMNGASTVATRAINFTGNADGSAFFWGVIDKTQTFDKVAFQVSGGSGDIFAFDNMTVGSLQQVVPEPSTYLLLATGLLGIGIVAWRRREGTSFREKDA